MGNTVPTSITTNASDALLRIFPNPASALAHVKFTLPKAERVSLKIFSVLGVEVSSLLDADLSAGEHSIPFSLIFSPSSVLFLRLQTATFSIIKPIQILR